MSKQFYLLLFMSRMSFIDFQHYFAKIFCMPNQEAAYSKAIFTLVCHFSKFVMIIRYLRAPAFSYLRTKLRFQNMCCRAFVKESTGELSLQTISALPMLLKCPEVYCTFIFCGLINLSTWRIYIQNYHKVHMASSRVQAALQVQELSKLDNYSQLCYIHIGCPVNAGKIRFRLKPHTCPTYMVIYQTQQSIVPPGHKLLRSPPHFRVFKTALQKLILS